MCGRFNYSNTKRLEGDLPPRYNVAPGTNILVVNEDNKPQVLNWGYSPAWMKSGMIINAKRETLKSKPTFRHHTKAYTLINGWYEWKREGNKKQPYYFFSKKYDTLFIKTLIKDDCAVLITTQANDNITHIHNRMPLMDSEINWSSFNKDINDIDIDFYPVSTQVNYSKNDDKSLIEPLI
jgi:putative SOS response-associated peptidase YedK